MVHAYARLLLSFLIAMPYVIPAAMITPMAHSATSITTRNLNVHERICTRQTEQVCFEYKPALFVVQVDF